MCTLAMPCIEIISQQIKDNSVTVQFSGNAPFTCQVGNGQVSPCTSPHTFTELLEGKNTITISGVTPSQSTCSRRFDITISGIFLLMRIKIILFVYFLVLQSCLVLV